MAKAFGDGLEKSFGAIVAEFKIKFDGINERFIKLEENFEL